MVRALDDGELRRRARRLRLVLTDVDGVLTDGGVFYDERGETLKRFSVRDGMGVELLRSAGVETGFVTREASGFPAARAAKLGVSLLYTGVRDKRAALPEILSRAGVDVSETAYVGDDVNDLALLLAVGEAGLTGAPTDAISEVRRVVHHVTESNGGHGAFRDFSRWLLSLRSTEE